MKNVKFPFFRFCEVIYLGGFSAGILFVLHAFLQDELTKIAVFPEAQRCLVLIAVMSLVAQMLIIWSGKKRYCLRDGVVLVVANVVAGRSFIKYTERSLEEFLCYVGLEAACIAAAAIVYTIRKMLILKGLLIFAQIALLIVLVFLEKPFPIWCVGILLTSFLLFLIEIRAKGRKEVFGLLPIFAAAIIWLCMIPKKEEPMDWSWVLHLAARIRTAIEEGFEMLPVDIAYLFEGEAEFPFTGYDRAGKLGGSVTDNDRIQLHITGEGTRNPLYLTGKAYDTYTGERWEIVPNRMKETEQQSIRGVLKQSIYADRVEELSAFCQVAVEYRFIRTSDFFHDLNTTNYYGTIPEFREDESWTMEKSQGKDFSYQLRFLEINRDSDEIKELFRQHAWKEPTECDNELSERELRIYKIDTTLPDCLPQRVYELAHTIATDADNDYDRMVAFAEYLRNNYTYTKTPPEYPDGWEFVDHFLFEGKSGYCSYFATAMAVLGRCVGIPTRYVQGFMTVDTCKKETSDVLITAMQAHAWTEFYLEHIGWVRIDASPGFGENSADRWSQPESEEKEATKKSPSHVLNPDKKLIEESIPQEFPKAEIIIEEKSTEWYGRLFLKILVGLVMGCVLAVLLLLTRKAVRRRKYDYAEEPGKMQLQLRRLLRLGKLSGVPLSDGETLQIYQERIQDLLDTEEYSFARACTLYEGIRFGGKTVTLDELRELEAYAVKVENGYLASCGFWKRLVYNIL